MSEKPWRFLHSNEQLTDADVEGLPQEAHYEEIDLSRNAFGLKGLSFIASFCRYQWRLRVLKLYKSGLCDRGAEILAQLCLECPLNEMHLSHNWITARGAVFLVHAAERGRSSQQQALWLRRGAFKEVLCNAKTLGWSTTACNSPFRRSERVLELAILGLGGSQATVRRLRLQSEKWAGS